MKIDLAEQFKELKNEGAQIKQTINNLLKSKKTLLKKQHNEEKGVLQGEKNQLLIDIAILRKGKELLVQHHEKEKELIRKQHETEKELLIQQQKVLLVQKLENQKEILRQQHETEKSGLNQELEQRQTKISQLRQGLELNKRNLKDKNREIQDVQREKVFFAKRYSSVYLRVDKVRDNF